MASAARSLSLVFAFVGGTRTAGDDEAATAERYKLAAQAKESALTALEEAYERAEVAWHDWRKSESGRAPPLAALFAERFAEFERAAVPDSSSPSAPPAPPREPRSARKADVDQLARLLRETLEARGLRETALREALADSAARDALARGQKQEGEARFTALLAPWLGPDLRFELLWNERVAARADEVRRWRESYDDYIAAGVELDRVRHPESYLPGGAKTRTGMVYVPGGSYVIGPNGGFERKKRRVTLRPFLIDRCEVSNADYVTFLESLAPDQRLVHTPRHWELGGDGRPHPQEDRLDHPVVGVTWRDADAYARFANKRLPTEEEWEAAARGRDALVYPWGNEYVDGRCNDARLHLGTTVAVTRFDEGASPFKVLNLAGNVQEWTCSLEEGDSFTDLPSNIAAVIVRGGYFQSPAENVGGSFRWVAPGGSSREPYIGFRCVADIK